MLIREEEGVLVKELNQKSKIIGKFEIAVPFYNLKVGVYSYKNKKLSAILDAVLRLYNLFDKEENVFSKIGETLGLEEEEIKTAYYSLIDQDLIDYLNKEITDEGRKYINDNKYINREKSSLNIVINKITGKIDMREASSFIHPKDLHSLDLTCPYDKKKGDLNGLIDIKSVRKIWNYRKEYDPDKYEGDITEIIKIDERNNVYWRFNVYYLMNEHNKVEIRVFEKNRRDSSLEQYVLEQEGRRNILTKEKYDAFFEENVGMKERNIQNNYQEIIDKITKNDIDKDIYTKVDERLDLIFPLISFLEIPGDLEENIKKLLERKKRVNLYLCGLEFIDKFQRMRIQGIIKLLRKSRFGKVYSLNEYCPQTIIKDEKSSITYEPSIVPITINGEHSKVTQYTIVPTNNDILTYILGNAIKNTVENIEVEPWETEGLRELTSKIFVLLQEVDELLHSNGLNWSKNRQLLEIKKNLNEFQIVKNEETFMPFIKKIYIDFVESFKKTCKKGYFDGQFGDEWPELSDALNRIRVYRNLTSHDWLESDMKRRYFKFIKQDFNSYCPFGVENMYLNMQQKILIGLLEALRKTKEKILDIQKPF